MVLYLLIFFWLIASSVLEIVAGNSPDVKRLVVLNALILVLFCGLRWTTGTDWHNYYPYFKTLDNSTTYFEAGFIWFTILMKSVWDNYSFFLVIDTLIAVAFVVILIVRESPYPNASLLLFYCYYYLINYFGSSRRIIAIGLVLLAAQFLFRRKRLLAFILIAAAAMFHSSAGLFLLAFFIPRSSIRSSTMIITLAGCFVLANTSIIEWTIINLFTAFFPDNIFAGKAAGYVLYSDNYNQSVLINLLGIFKRAYLFIILLVLRKYIPAEKQTRFNYYFNLYFFSVCLYTVVNNKIDMLKVAGIYFSIFEIVLVGYILSLFITVKERALVSVLFLGYCSLQFYSSLFLNPYKSIYIPYYSVFSFKERGLEEFE